MAEPPETSVSNQVPPPSILYLFLWTNCAAALFALERLRQTHPPSVPSATPAQVWQLLSAPLLAASLAGGLLRFHWWRTQRLPLVQSPGHWLLQLSFLQLFIDIPFLHERLTGSGPGILWISTYALHCMVTAFATIQHCGWWKLFFSLQTLHWILACIALVGLSTNYYWGFHAANTAAQWVAIAGIALLFVTCIVERLNAVPRDWLHYVGVTSMLLTHSIPLISYGLD